MTFFSSAKKDINKTYILLEEKALDYILWLTNVPLDIKYRYNLPDELKPNLGRFSPLDDLELAYVAFMVYFEEIWGVTFDHFCRFLRGSLLV